MYKENVVIYKENVVIHKNGVFLYIALLRNNT